MSILTMPTLHFFRSSAAPCPYLMGRVERKLFARIPEEGATEVNSVLSRAGFRRSHDIIYRPACTGCAACVPVRVVVGSFALSDNHKRLLRRSRHLHIRQEKPIATTEQYTLFARYQNSRHNDGDMAKMSYDDYACMLREGQTNTTLFTLRDDAGVLMGVMLSDRLADGWSAVYAFYETDEAAQHLSLGTVLILHLIHQAKTDTLPYIYLGYWIDHSPKMAYKSRFQPLERLSPNGWVAF